MKNTNSAAESGAFVRKTRGYSVVQNEALFNDSLSMSAKGLYLPHNSLSFSEGLQNERVTQ